MSKVFVDYEREPVPMDKRRGWIDMGLVWIGVGLCLAALMLGGVAGFSLDLGSAMLAAILGYILLTVINALCSIVGGRTGLSTAMVCRFAYGDYGVFAVAAVLAIGCFGWFAVQLGLTGEALAASYQMLTGQTISQAAKLAGMAIIGVLMITTAIFGYRSISLLSKIAVPLLFIIIGGSLWMIFQEKSFFQLLAEPPPGQPMPFGVAVSIMAGSYMVGAVIGPDITRYAKSDKHAVGSAILGFLIGTPLVIFSGAIMAHAVGEWDLVKILVGLGWGWIGITWLIFAQWSTNDNNLYSAALNLSVIFRAWPKWKLTLAAGILGIILALWGIYNAFVSWLLILSALIPPVGGIYIADYFLFHKDFYKYENLPKIRKVRPLSFVSWIIGSLIGFCTTPPPTGFGLFTLTTVSALDSFLVAMAVQIILQGIYVKTKGKWPQALPL